MDNRFSRRWSNSTISLPTASKSSHVSPSQKHASSSPTSSKQRWSTIPTSTSSLSIVETIDYDTDSISTTITTSPSRRTRSKVHFRSIMEAIFFRKEKEMLSSPTKPITTKSIKSSKRDPVVLKHLEQKEGGGGNAWNRLPIVVRPTRERDQQQGGTPRRVDSGVDVKSLKEIEEKETTNRYSKYSSETSLQSSTQTATPSLSSSPPIEPLHLSPTEHTHLHTQLKTAIEMIQYQITATEAFSKNLAGLLWSKEHYINSNKRLSQDTKSEMVATLAKIRDQTAKTFCRKGVFLERSQNVLNNLLEILESNPPDTSSARSPSLDSNASSTPTLLNSSPSPPPTTQALTIQLLQTALQKLKADLTAHSHLDPALRNTVVLPTQEMRFPTTENERIAMRRFVRFVDGRVKGMREGEWEMGRWVRGVEGWVDDLVEDRE